MTTSGFCYAFGSGKNGRLGLGDTDDKDEPAMIYDLLDFTVESIHTTNDCSFACCKIRNEIPLPITHTLDSGEVVTTVIDSEKNIVYSWGKGDTGCLGNNRTEDTLSPHPVNLSIEEDITTIITGTNHVFALNEQRSKIYAWGNYYDGVLNFIKAAKGLKGNSRLFDSAGMSISTLKFTEDPITKKGSNDYGFRTSRPGFSFKNKEGDIKAPLQVHDEMKKQNQLNRIEIKTLDDEDLEEMNDCEIEVEAEDILEEDVKSHEEVFFEKLPNSDCKDPKKKQKIQDKLGDQTEDVG